jgi:REP element-mobilizing transposase RayT
VTICTQDRQHVFGEVVDGEMRLNDAGRMALSEWEALPRRFPTIDLDAFVIMPNHVHGIIVITQTPIGATTGATTRVAPTVGDVVGAFKSITTVLYTRGVKQSGWPPFVGRLWQRNYYEHIIRDERESERIREYILNNPANWATDEDNIAVSPASGPKGGRAARREEVSIDGIETKARRHARRP